MLQGVAFCQRKPYNSTRPKDMGTLVCLRRGGLVADVLLRNRGQQDIGAEGRDQMCALYLGATGVLELDAWVLIRQVYELCEAVRTFECDAAGMSTAPFEVPLIIRDLRSSAHPYSIGLGQRSPTCCWQMG